MLKFLRRLFANLRVLDTIDLKQMVDFESELLEQHNATVEDIKAINFILKREHGYDTGIFLPRRPGHIDMLTRVNRPLTIPMEIATEVEEYLIADDRARLARVTESVNPVPVVPPVTVPAGVVKRVRKAARRRKRS